MYKFKTKVHLANTIHLPGLFFVLQKMRLDGYVEGYKRQSPSSSGHTIEEPSVIHPYQA